MKIKWLFKCLSMFTRPLITFNEFQICNACLWLNEKKLNLNLMINNGYKNLNININNWINRFLELNLGEIIVSKN